MKNDESNFAADQVTQVAVPGVAAAHAQIAAARLRRESLIASRRLPGLSGDDTSLSEKKLRNYKLLRELHRGGQGVVYLALQESTDRQVAVKVFRRGTVDNMAELARFEREVEVLGRLKHPNVVTIHDCGRSEDDVYLVMDYVAGRPLDAYMAQEQPALRDSLALFAKICDGVNAAHLRGVIHRDLKPSNIRIDEAGEPRILDFGLAKLEHDAPGGSSAEGMTMTGQFIGSLPWTSPEQAEGRSDSLDIRTDVYSLGVMFYQLLTGKFPYPVGGRMDEVVRHIVSTNPARPSTLDQTIGNEVETILLKCLAKEPDRRYQSAGDLARDLRLFLAGEPIEAKRDSMRYVLRKQLRRHRLAVAVAMGFALLLTGGFITSLTLWYRAERALVEKEQQRELANQRAKQTREVADFQAQMLAEVDPQTMGLKLRADLIAKARVAAERSRLPTEELDAHIQELEKLIAGIDLTGMALTALDENIFQRALAAIEKQFAGQPLVKAQLLQTVATTLRDLGMLDEATQPQEEALAIRRRVLGDEHQDTFESMQAMGFLLRFQGKLTGAERYTREAMDKRRRVLGNENPETLSSIRDMGTLLLDQGKLSEAEPYLREALETSRRVLGDEHPDTLTSIGTTGRLLKTHGKLAEAEPYYREKLEKLRYVLGDEHSETLTALNDLSVLLDSQGKFTEAEPYLREAMERFRLMLGDEHPHTLTSINNLGFLLQAQGKLAEAEPLHREVLEKRRRVLGDEHPETIISLNAMGVLLQARGMLTEAEPYFCEAVDKSRRVLGDEHPSTIVSINNLGALFWSQRKPTEAEPLWREALEKRRRVLGDEHPETLTSFNNMGGLLKSQGKLAEAEPFLRAALETRRRVLGDEHPQTQRSVANMAGLLTSQGKPAEAEPYYRETLENSRRAMGDDHPDTLKGMTLLSGALRDMGQFAEAEALGAEAIRRGRATLPAMDRRTASFLMHHARTLSAMNRFADAEAEMLEALNTFIAALGPGHKETIELTESLIKHFDARDAAEPDKGYDVKAAECRAKYAELEAFDTTRAP